MPSLVPSAPAAQTIFYDAPNLLLADAAVPSDACQLDLAAVSSSRERLHRAQQTLRSIFKGVQSVQLGVHRPYYTERSSTPCASENLARHPLLKKLSHSARTAESAVKAR